MDSQTDPVEPISASEVQIFDETTDVVVVGLGCAGACAAIEAAESGAGVTILEAAAIGGGTSAMSGGLIYLGGGTPVQQACGFSDDPDNMARFLVAACGPDADEAKIAEYCEGSVEHFEWLEAHGVPFERSYHPEHDREPPDTSGLIYSGGEDSWPFTEIARPAPRGHHPAYPDTAGGFLMQRLLGAVDAAGPRLVTDADVRRLIVDAGEVVGVEASVDGTPRTIRATAGVVLAAGGFMFNHEMVATHCPVARRCNWPIGTHHDDGSAIRMAEGAGAAVLGMDRIEVGMPITPPRRVVAGILVNGAGRRFVNEDTYAGRIGHEMLLRQNGEVYMVHDDSTFAVNIVGYQARWVAESTAELEREIGLPAGSLTETLDEYNRHAARGEDPHFHKDAQYLRPLEPPYGVIDLRVETAVYAPFTLGGLHTDSHSRVLDDRGEPIAGLFAAGRTTAGIAAHGYVSGISLGDGTFFGRAAGRSAAG